MTKDSKEAIKVSIFSIILNAILMVFKLIAGILGCSFAMISDAIHSASDVFSTIVVMIGIKVSSKQPDEKHKYGHERFECITAIILAMILAVVGVGIGYSAVVNLINGNYKTISIPTVLPLIAAIVSIVIKELMFWITIIVSKKTNSLSLKADAWHHRSDAFSSIGSLVGIIGAMIGFPILDIIAGLIICIFILKVAIEIFIDTVRKLTDESCDESTENKMKNIIGTIEGVEAIKSLKTRKFGNKVYVDLEIACNSSISIVEANNIAKMVHNKVEQEFSFVKHINVYTVPQDEEINL